MFNDPLPPYAYVPGGPWPHPTRSPDGHSHGARHEAVLPIVGDAWAGSPAYLRGIQLFNAGYYWEAHEAWEALWHAESRQGTTADLIKALIKLAAAGVKVREGQDHGVQTHAGRALELIRSVQREAGPRRLGLDLESLERFAADVANGTVTACESREHREPRIVFPFRLEPTG